LLLLLVVVVLSRLCLSMGSRSWRRMVRAARLNRRSQDNGGGCGVEEWCFFVEASFAVGIVIS